MPLSPVEQQDLNESLALATEAEALRREYGGHWGLHPEFPLYQWLDAIAEQDTRLGYWEWIANAQRADEVEPVA